MPFWSKTSFRTLGVFGLTAAMLGIMLFHPLLSRASTFTDLDTHWAKPAVYRAAALDLVEGYPDGCFLPQQTLTQLETLVLFLRAGGFNLETRLNKGSHSSSDSPGLDHLPTLPWGQAYLELAWEKQLLPLEQIERFAANAPATRAQVAILLSRLLQLPVDLPALGNEDEAPDLPYFSDLAAVSPAELAAIIAVANQGLLQGYPDGTFGPQRTLTRGEAVMLLSRLLDNKWVHVPTKRILEGWVKGYSLETNIGAAEITSLEGSQKIKIHPEAKCFFQGQELPLNHMLDYQAEVLFSANQQAICFTLREKRTFGAPENKLTGSVKSVILGVESFLILNDLEGQDQILPFAWDARLEGKKASTNKGFQTLKPETFVEVGMLKDQVSKVTVLETKKCSGTIEEITPRRLYLATKGTSRKTPGWFNYYDRARCVDKEGKITNLPQRGDKVQVLYLDPYPEEIDDEIPLEITITDRPAWKTVKGTIVSSAGTGPYREISLGKNKTYRVDPVAQVYEKNGGQQIPFSTLKAGDKIEMRTDGSGVVMEIFL